MELPPLPPPAPPLPVLLPPSDLPSALLPLPMAAVKFEALPAVPACVSPPIPIPLAWRPLPTEIQVSSALPPPNPPAAEQSALPRMAIPVDLAWRPSPPLELTLALPPIEIAVPALSCKGELAGWLLASHPMPIE